MKLTLKTSKYGWIYDPRPIDYVNVKCNILGEISFLENYVWQTNVYEEQLRQAGLSHKTLLHVHHI